MFRTLAPLLLALCACLPAPFDAERTCASRGVTIQLERDRGCAYYAAALDDAVLELTERRGFLPAEEVPALLEGLEVWIHDDTGGIVCLGKLGQVGCYVVGHARVELGSDASSLAHELLHRFEDLHGRSGSAHDGWNERGAPAGAPLVGDARSGSWAQATRAWRTLWIYRGRDMLAGRAWN